MPLKPPPAAGRSARSRAAAMAFVVIAGALAALFAAAAAWPPLREVSTGATAGYPDVQPQSFSYSHQRVFAAVTEAIDALPQFDLERVEADAPVVHATARAAVFGWRSEVDVRVEPNGDGGAIVFITSRSREGLGDFGQNARHIRALQQAIAANLGAT